MMEIAKIVSSEHVVRAGSDAAGCMRRDLISILTEVEQIYHCQYVKSFDATALKVIVKEVADTAIKFADCVNDLYYFCIQSNFLEIKEGLRNKDSAPLLRFLDRKRFYIEETKSHHSSFCGSLSNAREVCSTGADELVNYQSKARVRKNAARGVGGTAAAATLAGGTTVSIVAGYFTFGIGTAIGLPITFLAAITAGAITHFVAQDFRKTEKTLRKHANQFASIKDIAERIYEPVNIIVRQFVCFERQHKSMQHMQHYDYHICCCTLNRLYEISTQQYAEIVQLLEDIERFRNALN